MLPGEREWLERHKDGEAKARWVSPILCISKRHVRPVRATWRMEWVTGPVTYCDECAAMMRQVADALGVHVAERNIAPPDVDEIHRRRLRVREEGEGSDG